MKARSLLTRHVVVTLRPLACLSFVIVACSDAPPASTPDEYPVATPSVGATFQRQYVGQVQATRYVEFRARHKGVIEQLGVDEGQRVRAGQLLFTISARELQQELAKAEAAVETATAELKAAQVETANTRMLVEKKVLSGVELDVAEAKLAALAARVREAKAAEGQASVNLSWAKVHAPFEGVINRLPRKLGNVVLEDELLTTLTDTSEVFVYFRVSEQEYLEFLAAGEAAHQTPARLLLANGASYPHEGLIDAVESEFDKETGNLAFRARFPNPEQVLKHGATGKVVLERRAPEAVVVPQSATFELQENLYVFTVEDDGTVRSRRVVPKARLKNAFVLESGLSPSSRIVVEGAQRLKDGSKIIAKSVTTSALP